MKKFFYIITVQSSRFSGSTEELVTFTMTGSEPLSNRTSFEKIYNLAFLKAYRRGVQVAWQRSE